jgi:hypothetical protein
MAKQPANEPRIDQSMALGEKKTVTSSELFGQLICVREKSGQHGRPDAVFLSAAPHVFCLFNYFSIDLSRKASIY